MSIARRIAKNTFFNSVATTSDLAINLVVGIMLARGLGTEQYGLYSYLLWFLGFGVLAANLGLGEMVKRFVAEALGRQSTGDPKGLVRLALLMRGLAALTVALVILVFSSYWAGTLTDPGDQIYFVLLAFILVPNVLTNVFGGIFAGFQKYEYRAYLILGTNPLRAVVIVVFMVLRFGIQEVLLLNMGTWILGVFIGLLLLRRLIPLKDLLSPSPLDKALRNSALKYALARGGIFGLDYFAAGSIVVLLVGLYCPVEEVGFYTLASKLPQMAVRLVPAVLGAVLLPAISEQFGKGDMDKLRTIYVTSARYLMMLTLPLAAAGMALAGPIVNLLYGTDYAPVIVLMQILFIPSAMAGISFATTAVIYGTNKPTFVLKAQLIVACLTVGTSLWLIPRYGVLGAAIGTSVPRFLAVIIFVAFVSRRIGLSWPLRDSLRIALASSLAGVALFGLQSHLSIALSLVLSIPVGLAIYIAAILALRVIHTQDLLILKGIQNSLPPALRRHYAALIRLVERMVGTKPGV